jgi:hypothetical protein
VFEAVIDRTAIRVLKRRKTAAPSLYRRQGDRPDPRSWKSRHWQTTRCHSYFKSVIDESRRNSVCPHKMTNAKQMLDIDEGARGSHVNFPHSLLKSSTR